MRWLSGNASETESLKWTNWLNEDSLHAVLVSKAYRLLEMPFKQTEVPSIEQELLRLKRSIRQNSGSGIAAKDY